MLRAAGRPVALAQGPRVQKGGIRRGEAIDWAQVGGFGEAEAILQGLVRAVDAAKGGLFLPDLQDETRASLVATHEASPGSCPVDFAAFEATRWETVGHSVPQSGGRDWRTSTASLETSAQLHCKEAEVRVTVTDCPLMRTNSAVGRLQQEHGAFRLLRHRHE